MIKLGKHYLIDSYENNLQKDNKIKENVYFWLALKKRRTHIHYYWDSSDLESKLKLQKTVFTKGLVIVPSRRGYLTRHVNYFFRRIPLFSRSLQWRKTKKVDIADNFSLLVAGDQAMSNFLEGYELVVDLWKYMNRRDD